MPCQSPLVFISRNIPLGLVSWHPLNINGIPTFYCLKCHSALHCGMLQSYAWFTCYFSTHSHSTDQIQRNLWFNAGGAFAVRSRPEMASLPADSPVTGWSTLWHNWFVGHSWPLFVMLLVDQPAVVRSKVLLYKGLSEQKRVCRQTHLLDHILRFI